MQLYILEEEINKKISKTSDSTLDNDKSKEKDKTGNTYEKFQGRGIVRWSETKRKTFCFLNMSSTLISFPTHNLALNS